MAILHTINSAFLVILLWATSLSLGMQFTLLQILAPFKRMRLVGMAVALNLIVVPVIGWGLTRALLSTHAMPPVSCWWRLRPLHQPP